MSTIEDLDKKLDTLRFDYILSVSVLGVVCGVLVLAVLALIAWNVALAKRIKKLDPFVNFRLQRPKISSDEIADFDPPARPQKNGFDNPGFLQPPPPKRDLNPIALRSKASIDNGNFIFGTPNNQLSSNSFKSPDYLDLDSRFY